MVAERCDECGFDAAPLDRPGRPHHPRRAGRAVGPPPGRADEHVLHTRPSPQQWSIAEYTQHLGETLWAMRFLVDLAQETPGHDLGEVHGRPFDPEPAEVDLAAARARLSPGGRPLRAALAAVASEAWPDATVTLQRRAGGPGLDRSPRPARRHAPPARRRTDPGAPSATAWPTRSARSPIWPSPAAACPSAGVDAFDVGWSGVDGDVQADRRHHGRPFQALSPVERGCDRRAPGPRAIPIDAGLGPARTSPWPASTGPSLRPGTIVRIGSGVGEISSYATPCAKNAGWFADRNFRRMDHDEHPGWSRLYATVLEPGQFGSATPSRSSRSDRRGGWSVAHRRG